ncbi:MAG TPA: PEGA domain-containing protein [Pyrinomonadaceae bacterium]|nr:PEGA domain-containing protein [Pyrinomonadaceae bacterium]
MKVIIAALAVSFFFLSSSDALAAGQEVKSGRIEISTTPGSYPILIDGEPAGETSPTVRLYALAPGSHTIEIRFPNNVIWRQDISIAPGERLCLSLVFSPLTLSVERSAGGEAAAGRQPNVEQIESGQVNGTLCDCGEISEPGGTSVLGIGGLFGGGGSPRPKCDSRVSNSLERDIRRLLARKHNYTSDAVEKFILDMRRKERDEKYNLCEEIEHRRRVKKRL